MSNWLASLLMTADNKKLLAYNVFNTETRQLKPIPADKFIEILKTNKDAVENARISSNGELETDGALERYNKFLAEATNTIKALNRNQVMNYVVLGYSKDTNLKTFLLLNPYTGQLDIAVEAVIGSVLAQNRCGLANAKLSNDSIVGLGKPLKVFNTADYKYNKYTKNDGKIQVLKEEESTTLIGYYGYNNKRVDDFNYLIDTHMNVLADIDVLTINEKEIRTDKFASSGTLNETSALRIDLRNKAKTPLSIKKLVIDLRNLTDNDRYRFARNIFIECNTVCTIGEVELILGQLRISSLNFGANINDINRLAVSEVNARADYSTSSSLYVTRDSLYINTKSGFCTMSRESRLRTDNKSLTFKRVELGTNKIYRVIFDEYVYFNEIYDTRKKNTDILNVYGFGNEGYTINNLGKQNMHLNVIKPRITATDKLNKLNITAGEDETAEIRIDKANIELDELDVNVGTDREYYGIAKLDLVSNQPIKSVHIKKIIISCDANRAAREMTELKMFNFEEPTDVYVDELKVDVSNINNFVLKMPNVTIHTKTNSNVIDICERLGIKYIIDDIKKSDEIYSYKAKMFGSSTMDILAENIKDNVSKSQDGQWDKVDLTLTGKEKELTDSIITCFKLNRASDETSATHAKQATVVKVDKAFKNIIEALTSLVGNNKKAIEGNYVLDNLAYTYLQLDKKLNGMYCTNLKIFSIYKFDNASITVLGAEKKNRAGLDATMVYVIAEVERRVVYFNYIPDQAEYCGTSLVVKNIDDGLCLHGTFNKDILNELISNGAILYTDKGYSITIGNTAQELDISDVTRGSFSFTGGMLKLNNMFAGMFTIHFVDMKKHKGTFIAIDAEGTVIQLDLVLEVYKEYSRKYDRVKSSKFVAVNVDDIKNYMYEHTKNSLLLKVFRQYPNERLDRLEEIKENTAKKINVKEILDSASTEEAIIKLLDTNICYNDSKVEMFDYATETVKVTDNIYKIQADLYDKEKLIYYEFDYCHNKKSYFTLCNLEETVNQIRRNTKKDAKLLSLSMNNIYCFDTTQLYDISNYFIDLCIGDTIENFIDYNCRKRVPITSLNLIADAEGKICLAALYYAQAKLYLIPVLELMNVGALVKNAKANIVDDMRAVTDYRYSNKQLQKAIENYIKYLMDEKRCKLVSNTQELMMYETNVKDVDIKNVNDYTIKGLLALKRNQEKLEKQTILMDLNLSGALLLSVIHITNCDMDKIYLH